MIFFTMQVPVISYTTILFTCYYSRKLSVNCICRTVAISFCSVVLHAWWWTVSSASTHNSWRIQCLNYENPFFSLCVLLTEYTICLCCHKYRQWSVTHSVTQEDCIYGDIEMMILSQIFLHLGYVVIVFF